MSTSRTFAIGDIHGGLRAIKELLEIIAVTQNDHLIFLGDYVDGWSDSAETVFFLMDLKKKYKCTFIRGNHDDLCYEWLKTCLLYTSPSPRDGATSRMPSSA